MTKLILGRGEVYFGEWHDPRSTPTQISTTFDNARGELYLGNTPEFSVTHRQEFEDAADSYDGMVVPIEGAMTSENHTARFVTDHMDMDNVAMFYGQRKDTETALLAGTGSEDFFIERGRSYQVGRRYKPQGLFNLSRITLASGGFGANLNEDQQNAIWAQYGCSVDLRRGRLNVSATSTWSSIGQRVPIAYAWNTQLQKDIVPAKRALTGMLRFVPFNPEGPQREHYYPYVILKADGEIDLKAPSWQQVGFTCDILRRQGYEQVYVSEL